MAIKKFLEAIEGGRVTAVDFGNQDALASFGPLGFKTKRHLKLPPVKGGTSTSKDFIRMLEWYFERGQDQLVESSTIGSSGVEADDVLALMDQYPDREVWIVTTRLVKNYKQDNPRYSEAAAVDLGEDATPHAESAWIIYQAALENPNRVTRWAGAGRKGLQRVNRSVRPHDKRGYKGPIPDMYMSQAPDFEGMPVGVRELFGNDKGYLRASVLPFLMAFEEEGVDTWAGYVKVIGLYEHGFPSFYRRKTVELMQSTAKRITGAEKMSVVGKKNRGIAWDVLDVQIKAFYFLYRGDFDEGLYAVDLEKLSRKLEGLEELKQEAEETESA